MLFLLYTGEIKHIIDQYNLQSQCYADDCQVYSICKPDKKDDLVKSTLTFIKGLSVWMVSNRLKLNLDMNEFIWTTLHGSEHLIDQSSIIRHGINIQLSFIVQLLAVYIDEVISFEACRVPVP